MRREPARTAPDPTPITISKIAEVRRADGQLAARAMVFQTVRGAVQVRIQAAGLAPGQYGAHIHAVGRCDGPDFESAGPHWNPLGRQHGSLNPEGPHLGDLTNLTVGEDGHGRVEFALPGGTLTGDETPLFDADGASIVIHAAPDDYRTDPAGNSGARIACAVLGLPDPSEVPS
ncbi:MAG TPA: superoxide dismutase family protein [Allosphingosinicella sp.]|nr:superoxide dismutase family protein [Allosphingosinicella sp.]